MVTYHKREESWKRLKNLTALRDLEIAEKILREREANLVVVRNGKEIFTGFSNGLKDLAEIVLEDPKILRFSSIADRIVGKAVAVVCVAERVRAVYADMVSFSGLRTLRRGGVKVRYEKLVNFVRGRDGRICPFEMALLGVEDLKEAYERLLREFRKAFGPHKNVI